MIFHVVDNHLLITPQNYARCRIVSILVRHHVEQLHGTMRGCRDGQRNIYRLTVGIRSTRISGDVLVIHIDRTLDEPIVSRHGITATVLSTDIIAVVDDNLGAVYEVS